jgi:hypothetical protein
MRHCSPRPTPKADIWKPHLSSGTDPLVPIMKSRNTTEWSWKTRRNVWQRALYFHCFSAPRLASRSLRGPWCAPPPPHGCVVALVHANPIRCQQRELLKCLDVEGGAKESVGRLRNPPEGKSVSLLPAAQRGCPAWVVRRVSQYVSNLALPNP